MLLCSDRAVKIMTQEKTVLLMVGRAGYGKSSTGNNIAGSKNLKVKEDWGDHGAIECATETFKHSEKIITIIDGVSILDTDNNDLTRINMNIDKCFKICDDHITAILIVLRFGFRYTDQEKKSMQLIQRLFGSESIKNNGIIVLSYGDNFNKANKFEAWLEEQQGDIRTLLNQVNNRVVLFDNTQERDLKNVDKLFEYVETVRENKPYNRGLFLLHDRKRETEKYTQDFENVMRENASSSRQNKDKTVKCIQQLNDLLRRIKTLKQRIYSLGNEENGKIKKKDVDMQEDIKNDNNDDENVGKKEEIKNDNNDDENVGKKEEIKNEKHADENVGKKEEIKNDKNADENVGNKEEIKNDKNADENVGKKKDANSDYNKCFSNDFLLLKEEVLNDTDELERKIYEIIDEQNKALKKTHCIIQ